MTMTSLVGDFLELVCYPDGGCGLLRNGQPVADIHAVPCQMGECVEQLLRFGWHP